MLPQFVKAYRTVYTALGMTPAAVTAKHVLEILTRMNNRMSRVRARRVKFNVRPHVTISKKKILKLSEQNYTDEILIIVSVIRRRPQPVYELEDL